MDTNEIMTNEEVMETTEEIVKTGYGKAFKAVAGIGLTVLAGGIVYKYIAKPFIAKLKAQKEQRTINEVIIEPEFDDEVGFKEE